MLPINKQSELAALGINPSPTSNLSAARNFGLMGLSMSSPIYDASPQSILNILGSAIPAPPKIKRKVFISYHHKGDQWYYNEFARIFANVYEVFEDKSLERAYNSDNDDYVRFQIRSKDITGSSCTIVLCGPFTHQRKYVDWEIKATLDKNHGLIGVWLPHLPLAPNGGTDKPARLQDNIDSGYANWIRWDALTVDSLKNTIESAISRPASKIVNDRLLRKRNG